MVKECCCSEEKVCQSCGMPLTEEALCDTKADGPKTCEYCIYCYKGGAFTEPNLTADRIIEKGATYLAKEHNIELDDAKKNNARCHSNA